MNFFICSMSTKPQWTLPNSWPSVCLTVHKRTVQVKYPTSQWKHFLAVFFIHWVSPIVSSADLLAIPLKVFWSLLISSINVTWSIWSLIAIQYFTTETDFFLVFLIYQWLPYFLGVFIVTLSFLPLEKLERNPGIQVLNLSGLWGKGLGNCSPFKTSSTGTTIQDAPSKRQGSATWA